MKLTAQLKLQPTPDQADLLKKTLEAANAACNAISEYAWENKIFNQFKLHKALYYALRGEFGLAAQMAIRCLGKVADSYKVDNKVKRAFREHGSVPYDSRILAYRQPTQTVSIWVLSGRIEIPYQGGE